MMMQLYAVRYGVGFRYGTEGTVRQGAQNPDKLIEDFPFFYYIGIVDGEIILFDTGFRDKELAQNMGVTLLDVQQELHLLFGPNINVSKIILTHNHWDHVGNVDLYDNADVYMTEETYHNLLSSKGQLPSRYHIVTSKDFICNLFTLQLIGGHTDDSSVILFEHCGKKYCVTGDECYLQENMLQNLPIGICTDSNKNRDFLVMGNREKWIPLPFHDKKLLDCYKRRTENIVQII